MTGVTFCKYFPRIFLTIFFLLASVPASCPQNNTKQQDAELNLAYEPLGRVAPDQYEVVNTNILNEMMEDKLSEWKAKMFNSSHKEMKDFKADIENDRREWEMILQLKFGSSLNSSLEEMKAEIRKEVAERGATMEEKFRKLLNSAHKELEDIKEQMSERAARMEDKIRKLLNSSRKEMEDIKEQMSAATAQTKTNATGTIAIILSLISILMSGVCIYLSRRKTNTSSPDNEGEVMESLVE